MSDLFLPVVQLYEDVVEFMPLEQLKEGDHPTLPDQFVEDWGIFDSEESAREFFDLCGSSTYDKNSGGYDPFCTERGVGISQLFWRGDYEASESLLRAWHALKVEIASKNRFFAGRNLVEPLTEAIALASTTLPKSSTFYRARVCEKEQPRRKKEMGAPPVGVAASGRANPAGIPYLYLASTSETAAAELRPHVNDLLSVARFQVDREIRVVDLRGDSVRIGSPFRWGDRLRAVAQVSSFLGHLSRELSRPVSRVDPLEWNTCQRSTCAS